MKKIRYAVKDIVTDEENKIVRAKVGNSMESTGEPLHTNEIPLVLASLSRTLVVDENNKFTYTFPFKLA
ncbi:hypothetical protein LJB80_00240 [Bacteroides sp. OttesenSCG-928-F21]|nr:hypothetical protein [Bacteroides sp. OttesenSCG-928-F21]